MLSATMLLAGCTLWHEHEVSNFNDATGGEGLERSFWKEVKAKRWNEIERHLSSNYVSFTPQEGRFDRTAALDHLKQLQLDEFTLGDLQTELNTDTLVVTYAITMRGRFADQPLPADPVRMMTSGGTYFTLRCYLDDEPIFLGRNGRISVFTSERAMARYLADEHDHDLSDLATYDDIRTAATDGSLQVTVGNDNVYMLTGIADDLADGPDAIDRDQLELAVELLRDVGDYAEDTIVEQSLDADQPLGRVVLTGQRDLHGQVVRDPRGQPQQAAGAGHQTALDLGQAEFSLLAGHHQVAGQHQLKAPCQRVALHRRDDRLDRRLLRDTAESPPGHNRRVPGQEALQVHASAEVAARSGQDQDAHFTAGVQLIDRSGHAAGDRAVHGVARLRPVDGDDGNAVTDLGQDWLRHRRERP